MRIRSINIKNFRNLRDITVPLCPGAVIVGENGTGKSNLLYALRLALDPTLPSSDRHLRREDFSDALGAGNENYDPFAEGAEIEISVEFDAVGDDPKTLALLGASLIEEEPRRARIMYRFAPRDTAADSAAQNHCSQRPLTSACRKASTRARWFSLGPPASMKPTQCEPRVRISS